MNQHVQLKAEASVSPVDLDGFSPGQLWELQVAAGALEKAAIRLRAVPNFPDCQDVRASYRAIVNECIEDMRKVLADA
jgi:hypothetical protein